MTAKLTKTKTPGIYRKGSRYVVIWRHKGRQHKQFFATMAEAREAKGRRASGDRRKPTRVRVSDYAERWIDNYRGRTARGFAETTRREYRRALNKDVLTYFGTAWLDQVEAQDVKEWLGWLEGRGCSQGQIRQAKAVLSAMMADAAEEGAVRANPARGVRWVPKTDLLPKAKPRDLTVADLAKFLEATPPEWRLFFTLLSHTGLRVSEALGLTWANVGLGDDPTLEVLEQVYEGQRKRLKSSHSTRTLPLSPGLAVELGRRKLEAEYGRSADPVFANTQGQPVDYGNLYRRVFEPARKASGVQWPKGRAMHAFRHLAASLQHQQGKTPRQLCDYLGHGDPAFTLRTYVGQVDEGLGDAAFLDELIPAEGQQKGNNGATEHPETTANGSSPDQAQTRMDRRQTPEQQEPAAT